MSRQLYVDKPDPIIFMSVSVNTSGHVYDNFVRLIFLYVSRESGVLSGELKENLNSHEVHFLHTVSLTNLKDSVGLILTKTSEARSCGLLFPSTCQHGLSYLYSVSFTLVESPSSYSFPRLILLNTLSDT